MVAARHWFFSIPSDIGYSNHLVYERINAQQKLSPPAGDDPVRTLQPFPEKWDIGLLQQGAEVDALSGPVNLKKHPRLQVVPVVPPMKCLRPARD